VDEGTATRVTLNLLPFKWRMREEKHLPLNKNLTGYLTKTCQVSVILSLL
jgi:hypothetical protein